MCSNNNNNRQLVYYDNMTQKRSVLWVQRVFIKFSNLISKFASCDHVTLPLNVHCSIISNVNFHA